MLWLVCLLLTLACTDVEQVSVVIGNPLPIDRTQELAEVEIASLPGLVAREDALFIITDTNGREIPYQRTYDQKLLFPVKVEANGQSTYYIRNGTPHPVNVVAYGKQYPERVDDIAWENDRIAFRTYGPALQASGERAFGYDIWAKRVAHPVVDARYAKELNPETQAKLAELRKSDPEAARALAQSTSYHNDHGDGLDYYSVGPTLGAGTSALMVDSSLIYPYCYSAFEILDNGPLRFTVRLTYLPLTIGSDTNVVETRIISLDAGSQLNRAMISYEHLSHVAPIATGLVIHANSDVYQANASKGYIAYAEPVDPVNGQLFVAAVFTQVPTESKAVYFSKEEKKLRANANGHVLAFNTYQPGSTYNYYFGAGWSKWGFDSSEAWFAYVADFAEKVRHPFSYTISSDQQ